MRGKEKCRILKEIRQRIADENDIPYVTRECTYQGSCKGTCPKCESELRYLEQQLARRSALGKRVTIAAVCAGMSLALAGCSSDKLPQTGSRPADSSEPEVFVTEGEIAMPIEDESEPEPIELSGYIEYEPEDGAAK